MKKLAIVFVLSLGLFACSNASKKETTKSETVVKESFSITAKQIIDAIDSGEASVYAKLLTEDSRFRFGNYPMVQGKKAVYEAQTSFYSSVKSLKHEILRTWKDDNSIVVDLLVTYIRHDDTTITLPVLDVFEIKDNKVDATLIYMDINPLYNTKN